MKTLALSNGDLVAGPTGHATISGSAKIHQDLALDLGERWGFDRFHGDIWGSILVDFIGHPITPDLQSRVREEVSRAIAQYIAIQDTEIYQDLVRGSRSRYATADVIRQVNNVQVQVLLDEVRVRVDLMTQAGVELFINRTVTL